MQALTCQRNGTVRHAYSRWPIILRNRKGFSVRIKLPQCCILRKYFCSCVRFNLFSFKWYHYYTPLQWNACTYGKNAFLKFHFIKHIQPSRTYTHACVPAQTHIYSHYFKFRPRALLVYCLDEVPSPLHCIVFVLLLLKFDIVLSLPWFTCCSEV